MTLANDTTKHIKGARYQIKIDMEGICCSPGQAYYIAISYCPTKLIMPKTTPVQGLHYYTDLTDHTLVIEQAVVREQSLECVSGSISKAAS